MKIVPSNYILVTAQYGSMSKAAEKLGISQPALSAHIKKLEEQLGVTVFDRASKPLALTDAGRVYAAYTKKCLELENSLEAQLADLENLQIGNLVIGGASFFNISYLPKAVAAFAKGYPGIDIEVVDGKMPEIIEKALNNEIDLFMSPPWQQDERFCYEKVLSERIFLCVPPEWTVNDQLADRRISFEQIQAGSQEKAVRPVDFRVFKDMPFVLLKEDQHIGNIMQQLFKRGRFVPAHHIEVEQTMTSYAFTLAGAGISLMTESTIQNSPLKDYPAFYITEPDICKRDMYIAYPKQKYLSRACKEFITVLKDSLAPAGQTEKFMD